MKAMMKPTTLSAVILAVALFITACGRSGPLPPPDKSPPKVVSTIPANGSVNVPVNLSAGITVLFSKAMNAATIDNQTVALADGQNNVPGSVVYTESSDVHTAVFTPLSTLNPTTLYKITVDATVQDMFGIHMGAPYICSFNTGTVKDTVPPTIVATTPRNGEIGVMPNGALSVTFSEFVDQQTISFLLSAGSTTLPCTMSYSGTTAIFTPLNILASNTTYTATLGAGVKDLAGNAMPNDYSWGFKTSDASDITPPFIIATTPRAGATGVAINIAPSITFSEPVDQQTISFLLSAGSTTIPCTMSYSGTTAIFTPLVALAYSAWYTATVSAGVKDLAGNAMPNAYSWGFMTSAAPDITPPFVIATTPLDGARGVAMNITPSITFSEPVDQQTISFLLSAGSTTIPCTMSYSGTTAIFTPLVTLAYSTPYTATVSAGVKDLAGNAMPSSKTWSFDTGTGIDTTPPIVSAVTPPAGATGVAANVAPGVTFSEPVDSTTITFTLKDSKGAVLGYTMSYSGTTAIFTPSPKLKANTDYNAQVSAGVKDLAGNAMLSPYSWSFTTKK